MVALQMIMKDTRTLPQTWLASCYQFTRASRCKPLAGPLWYRLWRRESSLSSAHCHTYSSWGASSHLRSSLH